MNSKSVSLGLVVLIACLGLAALKPLGTDLTRAEAQAAHWHQAQAAATVTSPEAFLEGACHAVQGGVVCTR